jgi:hypothetical protein
MGRSLVPRYRVGLELSDLKDDARHVLVAGILTAGATSQLVIDHPTMKTSLALLAQKDEALTGANQEVLELRQQLRCAIAAEARCRSDVDGEVRTYASMTMNNARSPADIHGAGLPTLSPPPARTTPPEVPGVLDTILPRRGHGKAVVCVHETGKIRRQYAAEWSPEAVGPDTWSPLGVGRGKQRVVTGASGTRVWVRFATIRGELQSDWCTPVLVTIP